MAAHNKKLIYLTGFMGSGKSTIAPILANTLGYFFVDIDDEIQKATGKRITDLFSELGESRFREIEHQLLSKASQSDACVVSLGGGTIADQSNLLLVKSSGILVYLKTGVDHILHRLRNKTDRPLLKSLNGEKMNEDELRRRIVALLAIREPYYNQADITIPTDERTIGRTVDEIVRLIRSVSNAK
ncbi:MAG: shikimate kinase [Ignavibacteriae bacterium]|nr:shikimate kinase [Ignavibacteria bacterium]MBI3365686.1 shikimate kinase [Ignavibacteriota bacterium]